MNEKRKHILKWGYDWDNNPLKIKKEFEDLYFDVLLENMTHDEYLEILMGLPTGYFQHNKKGVRK